MCLHSRLATIVDGPFNSNERTTNLKEFHGDFAGLVADGWKSAFRLTMDLSDDSASANLLRPMDDDLCDRRLWQRLAAGIESLQIAGGELVFGLKH